MAKKQKRDSEASHEVAAAVTRKRHPARWAIVGAFFAILLLIGAGIVFYTDRALPNVMVGDQDVSQLTRAQIQTIVANQQSKLNVTFVADNKQLTASAKDLGVTVNIPTTVTNILNARRTSDVFQDIALWQTIHIPLVFTNDPGIVKLYVQQHYPSVFVDAKDAQLSYNTTTKQFDIMPGTTGKGFDITRFETSLSDLSLHPRTLTLNLTTAPVQPFIQASGLHNVQQDINQKINLSIAFTLNDKTIYQSKPEDIAGWTSFAPDTVNGTATIQFDKAKIQQFITDKISPSVASPPLDRKVVIDTATNTQSVLQEGQAGQQLADIDTLTDAVYSALQHNQPLIQTVSITQAPFKTITLSGSGRWIEVDLSKQTVTLYIGNTPLQSFLISSGTAATPTEVGTFAVWHKTPLQTMTETVNGEYYYIPNIPWVSYFDDGEAFHGTYWHHNFGHPMSHGCINMTIADAKIVYDFAPVGTKVVVHD